MDCPSKFVRDWDFEPSRPTALVNALRLRAQVRGWDAQPAWQAVRPAVPAGRWNALFLFAPAGDLSRAQLDTFERVSRLRGKSLVVVASTSPNRVPIDRLAAADALYWKDLPGYDFSAYAIAIAEIAARSPGATLYMQNDSVIGPFGDLDAKIDSMPWRLGGFLAAPALENHLQSFALTFRDVDQELVTSLASVLSIERSISLRRDVILMQESRLSRVASQHMTVGAHWFAPWARENQQSLTKELGRKLAGNVEKPGLSRDPSLRCASLLLSQGFPFLKRSLLGPHSAMQNQEALADFLAGQGLDPKDLA